MNHNSQPIKWRQLIEAAIEIEAQLGSVTTGELARRFGRDEGWALRCMEELSRTGRWELRITKKVRPVAQTARSTSGD